jgi:beta-N-acetylhexosaminidase
MIPPTAIPTPTPVPANDPQALLSRMSLEQKIGQVMVIGFDGTTVSPGLREMIEKYHVGGVILFARNVESPRQVAALTRELQEIALKSGHPGLITAIDQEGGRVARLTEDKGFSEFPGGMALGATGDPEVARQVARAIAGELKALGLNTDFAPVLDVNNNYKNPVIGIRSFGSDPAQVASYGVAFLEGLQGEGVLAFGKHFPGHGDTAVDSHLSLPVVPHARERLEAVEFVPFKAAMKAGVAGIMSAHVSFPAIESVVPDLPATLSPRVLTGLLRDEMGYTGLVATDSIEMGALAQSGYAIPLAPAMALQAGADLLLFNRDHALHQQSIEFITGWLKEGKIPQKRLDEAVLRVLQAKAKFGILEPALADPEKTATLVGNEATHRIAQEAARRSITLLRDRAGLIPLKKDANLLVIETGSSVGLGKALGASAIQLRETANSSEIAGLVGTAAGRTVIVATTDAINSKSQTDLVKALLKANIPTIVVAMRGPYDVLAFSEVGTYLATYGSPPPTMIALKAILMGEAAPRGKLPVEMP